MKKILLISICITIAIAGAGLSAQELKWSGYFNSGLGLVHTDVEDADPYLTAFGVDSGVYGYRFRLNGAYTNAAANAGVKFRFQSQYVSNQLFSLPYVYGWFKPIDMLTLNGGLVDDGTWNSGGALLNDDVGEGLGVLAKLHLGGLDAGLGAYLGSNGSGSNNHPLANLKDNTIDPEDLKYVFSLGYTMEDVFKIVASLRTSSRTNGGIDEFDIKKDTHNDQTILGFKLMAVPKLTAVLEVKADHLYKFGDIGTLFIYETLGYDLGALDLGLNAGQYATQADKDDLGLMFDPWVSYTLGKIVPRLDVLYFMAGKPSYVASTTGGKGSSSGKYNFLNWEAYSPVWDSDYSVLAFRPSVKFNIDSNTSVEVGDIVNLETGPDKAYGGEDRRLTNIFYVDFVWKF
ncbi:MAG: hypothetical protein LBO65_11060 [Spirochaetaceae bacterium]|nr:hypothetical protein [Spirochaetaceae bacterium]